MSTDNRFPNSRSLSLIGNGNCHNHQQDGVEQVVCQLVMLHPLLTMILSVTASLRIFRDTMETFLVEEYDVVKVESESYVSHDLIMPAWRNLVGSMTSEYSKLKRSTGNHCGIGQVCCFTDENGSTCDTTSTDVMDADREAQAETKHATAFSICGNYVNDIDEAVHSVVGSTVMSTELLPGHVGGWICIERLVEEVDNVVSDNIRVLTEECKADCAMHPRWALNPNSRHSVMRHAAFSLQQAEPPAIDLTNTNSNSGEDTDNDTNADASD
jgi:hypothetical protein